MKRMEMFKFALFVLCFVIKENYDCSPNKMNIIHEFYFKNLVVDRLLSSLNGSIKNYSSKRGFASHGWFPGGRPVFEGSENDSTKKKSSEEAYRLRFL